MSTIRYEVPDDIECPKCGFISVIDKVESDSDYIYVTYVCQKDKHVFSKKYRKI